jgi:hypothetical protein
MPSSGPQVACRQLYRDAGAVTSLHQAGRMWIYQLLDVIGLMTIASAWAALLTGLSLLVAYVV